MSINRLPEITFVFIVCLVDFVWKYRFGGERFPTVCGDVQKVARESSHCGSANILFFYQSSCRSNSEVPGKSAAPFPLQ